MKIALPQKIGLFAMLSSLLRAKGANAHSASCLSLVALAASLLVCAAASASATTPITFCPSGNAAGQCEDPEGVAVDESTGGSASGHVYVADTSNGRIDEFDSSGRFIRAFGWGVLNGAPEPQSCTATCEPGIIGSGPGQMFGPSSLAVDNSGDPSAGDLYVFDRMENRVQKFTPAGEFLLMFGGEVNKTTHANLCTAADIAGGDTCGAGLVGAGAAQFGGEYSSVAVDSSGHVWLGDVNRLEQFGEGGEFLSEVKLPGYGEIAGLAVDPFGDFYVLTLGVDEEQLLTLPSSGTFTLTFEGQTTEALGVTDTGQEIQVALEKLSTIGPGNVIGVGNQISFVKSLADTNVPQLLASAGSVETHNDGVSARLAKLSPAGEPLEALDASGHPKALGLDPATGGLFVSDQLESAPATLLSYNSSGVKAEGFGTGSVIGWPRGNALAFGDGVQSLYVASHATERESAAQIFPLPEPGPLSEEAGEAANPVAKTTATFNANVNPEGASTTVHFEYVDQHSFETESGFSSPHTKITGPESAPIGADFSSHPVAAYIVGLSPETNYRFRVVATNANGTVEGQGAVFTTEPAVRIDATYATAVAAAAATLAAQLNPLGDAGEYRFEYLTQAEYEADGESFSGPDRPQSVPVPDAQIAKGEAELTVSQSLQGLTSATAYRYRILAHDHCNPVQPVEVCTTTGPPNSFVTQGPSGPVLPDARAWELVSPPDKGGISLEAIAKEGADIQAAADGSGLAYVARGAIGPEARGSRAFANTQLLAHRSPAGWSTREIATAHEAPTGLLPGNLSEYQLFSNDLSLAAVQPEGPFTPLSPLASEYTPYLRQPGGGYTPLVTAENVPPGTEFGGKKIGTGVFNVRIHFVSATPDFAHLVLKAEVPLTTGFTGTEESLYEWSAGMLELLSQVPAAPATECGGAGSACFPAANKGLLSSLGNQNEQVRNAISADGNRAVFVALAERIAGHLFLRDVARGETLQLDAPQGGARGGVGEPHFQTASLDGSRVFFTDESRLTADSTAVQSKPDLYMCEVGIKGGHLSCVLSDLSVDHNSGEAADVLGDVIGVSSDGRYLYFAANGDLAAGAAHGNCDGHGANVWETPPSSSCNLYFYDTGTASIKLVAVLSNRDAVDWRTSGFGLNLGEMTARVSPDGRWLAFSSQRPHTGYDNRDAISGEPDQEVFLYHAAASEAEAATLRCASCNPTGSRPHGIFENDEHSPAMLVDRPDHWQGQWLAASVPGWTNVTLGHAFYQSRYLSNSGRLFFNAHDALVPQDSNGTEDVYQYEPPQVGGCTESSPTFGRVSGGCVDLISSGASGEESAFLDASETGNDVFFLTASKLASNDVDHALDVYDAHVCGAESFCPPPPPPPPPACEGDACQSPLATPEDPTPGSLTFQGPGNFTFAATTTVVKPKAKPSTTQRLARALKACRKKLTRKRPACERQARRAYGQAGKAKKTRWRAK